MNPDVAASVRRANEACILLLTLLVNNEDDTAAELVWRDGAYSEAATCMAVGILATSAIRALAYELGITPQDIVQSAGLTVAELSVKLEERGD